MSVLHVVLNVCRLLQLFFYVAPTFTLYLSTVSLCARFVFVGDVFVSLCSSLYLVAVVCLK